METRDLIVTPFVLLIVYLIAYIVRPRVTDEVTRKYFIPALTVRILGALAVGFIYQFYYSGGDTFLYHTNGSRIIWEAFTDSPLKGIDLLFANGHHNPSTFYYSQKIIFFGDLPSYFVIRVAAFLDFFTFSAYSSTAILFAIISFAGAWMLFKIFYELYPDLYKWISFSCLFVPTVFFWGSGIFKDTLTLAALEMATYYAFKISIQGRISVKYILITIFFCWIIYSIKIYILLTFLPALVLWILNKYMLKGQLGVLKILYGPFVFVFILFVGYLAVQQVAKDDKRYDLEKLGQTAQITAYDIRYHTGKDAGSGYSLGDLDGSFGGMLKLAPQAVNVSLFRPYIWEVRNPLMLLSALESLTLLLLTIYILGKIGIGFFFRMWVNPDILFCMIFSIVFAFAVGVSTYNFGTLSRYKIPLMPYYLLGIGLIYYHTFLTHIKSQITLEKNLS